MNKNFRELSKILTGKKASNFVISIPRRAGVATLLKDIQKPKPLNECDVINAMMAINEEEIAEQKFWDTVNARCHDER